MARREIQAGHRFQQTGSTSVWEVVDIAQDAEGIAHARLVRIGDTSTRKTLSVTALRDTRLYRQVPE